MPWLAPVTCKCGRELLKLSTSNNISQTLTKATRVENAIVTCSINFLMKKGGARSCTATLYTYIRNEWASPCDVTHDVSRSLNAACTQYSHKSDQPLELLVDLPYHLLKYFSVCGCTFPALARRLSSTGSVRSGTRLPLD